MDLRVYKITTQEGDETKISWVAAEAIDGAMSRLYMDRQAETTYEMAGPVVVGGPKPFTMRVSRDRLEIRAIEEDREKTRALKNFLAEILLP